VAGDRRAHKARPGDPVFEVAGFTSETTEFCFLQSGRGSQILILKYQKLPRQHDLKSTMIGRRILMEVQSSRDFF